MSPDPASRAAMPMNDSGGWADHPMYIALSNRLSATESTISTLSTQVNTLQEIVTRALPLALPIVSTPSTDPLDKADSIAALTQQISALSTSVAQLQRLQSQSQPQTRQPSRLAERDTLPSLGLGNLSSHSNRNQGQNVFNTGPLTAPHSTGTGPFGPSKHLPREFHFQPPQPQTIGQGQGQGRPQNPRSVSTNMLPPASGGFDGDKTWGPPSRTGGRPLSPGAGWPTSAQLNGNANGNVPTTPGGQQGSGQGGGGMMTPSIAGGNNGPSVPGAGIVVTKWDQLNLKPELVRSIQKYG